MSSTVIGDLALRWIITILFGAGIAAYVHILLTQKVGRASTVNHLLHLAMSAAMIVMAWGVGMNLLPAAPIAFFLLAGGWFAAAASRMSNAMAERLTNGYCAVMMAAMAWMFTVMSAGLAGQIGHSSSDHAHSAALGMDMSASEMAPHQMSPIESTGQWIAAVNWIAALGFAFAALYWACRYLGARRASPVPRQGRLARLEPLYQACTAAGTALMFGALL